MDETLQLPWQRDLHTKPDEIWYAGRMRETKGFVCCLATAACCRIKEEDEGGVNIHGDAGN